MADLTAVRTARVKGQVAAEVAQAHAAQRFARPPRRGRPCETVVTGFLIQDDSTHVTCSATAMAGQSWPYSTTERQGMPGHSLFQSVYRLLGRGLLLTLELYRQQRVCEPEGVSFVSKIDLAVRTFGPLSHPQIRRRTS